MKKYQKQIFIVMAIAFLFSNMALAANEASGFLTAVPSEVKAANFSSSLLGAILNVISWVVMIVGAVGLVGVGFKTVDSAIKTLASIDYGQATYGKLVGNIIAGIAIMLIFVGMMTFSWKYITAAQSKVGKGETTSYMQYSPSIANNHIVQSV